MKRTTRAASIVLACGFACAVSAQTTQPNPLSQFEAEIGINSGVVANTTGDLLAVVSEVVTVADAGWLRLRFDELTLAGTDQAGNASYLQITSLEDGAVQYLDAESARQWQYTSAYFNGESVLVELMAHPNSGVNELLMSTVIAGTPPVYEESICGPTDDRILSTDPRAARALPVGCTAWMIDDCEHCFLTAGHCNDDGNSDINVLQFNVPLSDNSCSFGGINHPGPEDQYPVDAASQQTNGGLGVGNDWGYLGAFANSNTGLLPWQAQGSWYTLDNSSITATQARVTGFGSVSASLAPCSWYAVQKTHFGSFDGLSGNSLAYGMDTTGGNSGSPVTDEATGNAIGIHTHGGCSSSGGSNAGTWANHAGLQAALLTPQGVCEPQGPIFTFPAGLPNLIDPMGQTLSVQIAENGAIVPDPATAELSYDNGSGAVISSLTHLGGDNYEAHLIGGNCLDSVSFSFLVDDTAGESYVNPGSGAYGAVIATGDMTIVDLDMNTNTGWIATDNGASTGQWERAVPGDFGRGDPTTDNDGSGFAWVTDNGLNADIDGGIVTLTTSVFAVASSPEAVLSYAIHHDTNDPGVDFLLVEVSNNNGSSWTALESIPDSTNGWVDRSFRIADFVTPTDQVVFRFTSRDVGTATITESAVDTFLIRTIQCDDCVADVNGDGSLTAADFTAWIAAFNSSAPGCDQNGDGSCTAADFTAWIANFNAGC